MKQEPIEISEIKIPEHFLQIKLNKEKEFEKLARGDTVFKHKNTYYLFEEERVIIFEEVKDEKEEVET